MQDIPRPADTQSHPDRLRPVVSTRARRQFVREMLLIVTSILIAFALDASWDAWRRRSDARHNRDALRTEFVSNRAAADRSIERHSNIQVRLVGLLRTLSENDAGSEVAVPDSLLSAMFEWRTQDWATGTLQSFLTSDGLQHVGDATLRSWIAGWPARIEDVNEDQELVRDYVNNVLIPSVATRLAVPHLVEPWRKSLSGTTNIRIAPELHVLVAARAAHQTLVVRSLETFRAQMDSVLARL